MQSPRKYPGRDRVISRDSARDYLWREAIEGDRPHPCERPLPIHAIGLPSMFEGGKPLPVEMQARCRKCDGCLAHRRRLWTARAVHEIDVAGRTWFGTLTVAPANRLRFQYLAERACGVSHIEALDASERFAALSAQLGKEATRFMKRLRKQVGPFRYLLVTEAHKSGDPHLHMLLHEFGQPIRKAAIESHWNVGFSQWKLVEQDRRAAVYVCKYLAKDALTRVRASQRYGQATKLAFLAKTVTNGFEALSGAADVATVAETSDRDDATLSRDEGPLRASDVSHE